MKKIKFSLLYSEGRYKILGAYIFSRNMNKKDWVATFLEDIKELDLENLSMADITNMKKGSLGIWYKIKIKQTAF